MKTLCVIATIFIVAAAAELEIFESSATGNLQALAGKWKPVESSHCILDPELVSTGNTGFEISIDKKLGDSHRRSSSPKHFDGLSEFLKKHGYTPVASGQIKFDHGSGGGPHVISIKDGSLYLWVGILSGGNPRIFIGRGSDESSAETVVVEWNSLSADGPVNVLDSQRQFATIIYERADQGDAPAHRTE